MKNPNMEVKEELRSLSLAELESIKADVSRDLEKLRGEAQSVANEKEKLSTGAGDVGSFSALKSRAENLVLELIVIETRLAEIDYARMIARRTESDKQMAIYEAEVNKAQAAFDKSIEKLKAAKTPYRTLHHTRELTWKPEEERAQGRIYELRKKQQALINRVVLPDTLPAPKFLDALAAGTLRAPEDVIN